MSDDSAVNEEKKPPELSTPARGCGGQLVRVNDFRLVVSSELRLSHHIAVTPILFRFCLPVVLLRSPYFFILNGYFNHDGSYHAVAAAQDVFWAPRGKLSDTRWHTW